jgi:serine/threonine protein kinase/Flp pilus assembly protein TadD
MPETVRCPRCGAERTIGESGDPCVCEAIDPGGRTSNSPPLDHTGVWSMNGGVSIDPSTPDGFDIDQTVIDDPLNHTNESDELALKGLTKYEIHGEIARGGMGVVLKGRDKHLNRDLAIKVLSVKHRHKPDMIGRFVEEARIGGGLQHPGIVPVHEVGVLEDERPYFTMKLVKGRTLASLLADRNGSPEEFERLLTIFEHVCQTMAYAHSRKVIHRDLKPANVMTGAFGEVQVMDWGLAKPLRSASERSNGAAGVEPIDHGRSRRVLDAEVADSLSDVTMIVSGRSGSEGSDPGMESTAGSILGTPAYMPPEQARGEIDRIDARSDVFGLGAILCEILTGKPPYEGKTVGEIVGRALVGDLSSVHERLREKPPNPDLTQLMLKCISFDPADRPRDADEVSKAIAAYRAGVRDRLRKAELDGARAQAKAAEEKKRRLLTMISAGFVLISAGALGAARLRQEQRRIERIERTRATLDPVVATTIRLAESARSAPFDDPRWGEALASARQIRGIVQGGEIDPESSRKAIAIADRVESDERAAKDRAVAEAREAKLIADLERVRVGRGDRFSRIDTDQSLIKAFDSFGININFLIDRTKSADETAIAEFVDRVRKLPAAARIAIASALDDWALDLKYRRRTSTIHAPLIETARRIDPDPFRDRLRAIQLKNDPEALRSLADSTDLDRLGVHGLYLLGVALRDAGELDRAVKVLTFARDRTPSDLWINYALGETYKQMKPPKFPEMIVCFAVVRALRPDLGDVLGMAQAESGNLAAAERTFRALIQSDPKKAYHHMGLGITLQRLDEWDAAIEEFRTALRLDPGDALAHGVFAKMLDSRGRTNEALAEYRESLRIKPDEFMTHIDYGDTLMKLERFDEAIEQFREAERIKPADSRGRDRLQAALKRKAESGKSFK